MSFSEAEHLFIHLRAMPIPLFVQFLSYCPFFYRDAVFENIFIVKYTYKNM